MSHVTYQIARIHRDELLREAAARKLATRPPSVSGPQALRLIRRVRPRLRKLSLLRLVGPS